MTFRRPPDGDGRMSRKLSPREAEVLEALGRREPLKSISIRLKVSISTVDSYRRRAQAKLGVTNRYDALRKWQRQKVLERG